ncbi:uncharacterized protein LOC134555201 isoform X3 [Prinia subflava]|uniref:uncharacterized protein LOC134555201 isoform X3 n=1 Tax=Prinia subflava TaxID=208062 RepID=UPI002FE16E03
MAGGLDPLKSLPAQTVLGFPPLCVWPGLPGRVAKLSLVLSGRDLPCSTLVFPALTPGNDLAMAAPSTLQPPLLCPCPAVNGKQMSVGCKHWMEGAGYKPHWIFMALFSQPFSERGCVLRGWHWPDCCSLYFSQPCPCGSPGGVGVFCVKGPMCREVARVTHASCLTLSPFGPGSAPCTGLTEIPFLETAKERVFAFSSGECDVMSLGSGQAGRDRPRWAQSRATRRHASGGKAVKNKQADEWQEEGATSGVPTLLPGAGRVAVLPGEPSTEAGSDPNPAVLASTARGKQALGKGSRSIPPRLLRAPRVAPC